MKSEVGMTIAIVFIMVVVVLATYTFTLSIASTTAHDSLEDMCKENGYVGVKAVAPFGDGFQVSCDTGEEQQWNLDLLS